MGNSFIVKQLQHIRTLRHEPQDSLKCCTACRSTCVMNCWLELGTSCGWQLWAKVSAQCPRCSRSLFPLPQAGWATCLMLHGARVFLLWQNLTLARTLVRPVPPPPAASHSVKKAGLGFSLQNWRVAGCQRRQGQVPGWIGILLEQDLCCVMSDKCPAAPPPRGGKRRGMGNTRSPALTASYEAEMHEAPNSTANLFLRYPSNKLFSKCLYSSDRFHCHSRA